MRKLFLIAIMITGTLLLSVAGRSTAQGQEAIDSNTIKMLKAMGPDQIQALLMAQMSKESPETQARVAEAFRALKLDQPVVETVTLKNKTVKFVPIAHGGQKKFYDNLKALITEHKKKGYVIFYEQIKGGMASDTITKLKFRKIVGIEPTRKMYSILTLVFPDIVIQPQYNLLGVTATDLNADVSITEYVAEYEKLYGEVKLEACDLEVRKDLVKSNCAPLPNNPDAVTLDFRNRNLAETIKKSSKNKIMVIYGAAHVPGVKKMLQN